jgi:cell division protein ZipA
MDELRWILLGLGVLLVVCIYLWGIRGSLIDWFRKPDHGLESHYPEESDESAQQDPLFRREPALGSLDEPAGEARSAPEEEGDGDFFGALEDPEEETERLNIVLTVMSAEERMFHGPALARAAAELGLRKGREGTFDCYADDEARGRPVFSIANVLEPGVFDWNDLDSMRTPGLVCFMRLPGSTESLAAIELLLSVTAGLAERLEGALCDDRRLRLSTQGTEHLRSEVSEFERKRRLEALRRRQA